VWAVSIPATFMADSRCLAFALRERRDKDRVMTSDRMMQAIGRIERAISRLETTAGRGRDQGARHIEEISRLKAALLASEERAVALEEDLAREQANSLAAGVAAERQAIMAFPDQDPHAINPFSHDKALAALRSLDSLIDDLQKARRDG
jgi:hypothetical protein